MKATELRLGNKVTAYGKEIEISASDFAVLAMYEAKNENHPYSSIQLIEEWLLKADFELWDETEEMQRYVLHNAIDGTSDFEVMIIKESGKSLPFIDGDVCFWGKEFWLHTLQNLYFALTGNELTFKK